MAPIPEAVAAAAPPEEPPGVIFLLCGLRVCPCKLFLVNQCILNAGVFVLPTIRASDFFRLLTTGLSFFAMRSFCILKPFVLA